MLTEFLARLKSPLWILDCLSICLQRMREQWITFPVRWFLTRRFPLLAHRFPVILCNQQVIGSDPVPGSNTLRDFVATTRDNSFTVTPDLSQRPALFRTIFGRLVAPAWPRCGPTTRSFGSCVVPSLAKGTWISRRTFSTSTFVGQPASTRPASLRFLSSCVEPHA
jgi:hypothetical protein